VDAEEITRLLGDHVIVKVVTVLDIVSLSVLELLEYGLTRGDINHAMTKGVIKMASGQLPQEGLLVAGDTYYQQFLNSKVALTELGRYLLDCIKECQGAANVADCMERFAPGMFSPPEAPRGPG
jgi:hypothetical protein